MKATYIKIDDAEKVGKEIQKNIEQQDGLILVSVTNNHESKETFIRIGIQSPDQVIKGLNDRAFKSLNPGTTLNFIQQVLSVLSTSHYKINTEISRIQKLN